MSARFSKLLLSVVLIVVLALGYVENLASHGFVVIATDHEDAPPDWVMTGHKELTRQWDVRALIDYAGQITAAVCVGWSVIHVIGGSGCSNVYPFGEQSAGKSNLR